MSGRESKRKRVTEKWSWPTSVPPRSMIAFGIDLRPIIFQRDDPQNTRFGTDSGESSVAFSSGAISVGLAAVSSSFSLAEFGVSADGGVVCFDLDSIVNCADEELVVARGMSMLLDGHSKLLNDVTGIADLPCSSEFQGSDVAYRLSGSGMRSDE